MAPLRQQQAALTRARALVLQAVAGGGVLAGRPEELARRFNLTPRYLGVCLRDLERGGWVAVETVDDGALTVRLGRAGG